MSIGDGVTKETFSRLPAWARHSISWALVGVSITIGYVTVVRDPLRAATITNEDQDQKIAANQTAISKLTDAVRDLVTEGQVQQANITALQHDRDDTKDQLNRIENKIDRMQRH